MCQKKTTQKAKKLKEEKGIAAYPDFVTRQKMSQEVLLSVRDFYCDNEFSRQLPGKKDYVSISKNQHMSKRSLLCNLKELYSAYVSHYPKNKIGFSKSASLRPK